MPTPLTDPNPDPRERLSREGAAALTVPELLALLLRSGYREYSALDLAGQLLAQYGGLRGLAGMSYAELASLPGMNPAKATQILAGLELGRRWLAAGQDARPLIRGAEDVARLLAADMESLVQEQFRVLLLDTQRRLIAVETVYIGSLRAMVVRPAEIFRPAVARNCASVVLAHNHPSGDATPSLEDVQLTEALIAAGRVLDIAVLDHVVIGHGGWASLRDLGLDF